MMNSNGSGSATNSGIDYQQRVAALFLVSMLTDYDISGFVDIDESLQVKQVSYETNDAIDDVKVSCSNSATIYCQVKRNVSLSTSNKSDFYKSLAQFADQFTTNSGPRDYFVLVTSSSSSSKITRELRKILESIRMNDEGFEINPLNNSEQDTFNKYKQIVINLIGTDDQRVFIDFSRKVYISLLDVEKGMPLETSIIMLLSQKFQFAPKLIWALLIKNSLHYAAQRMSINKQGLDQILNKYIDKTNTISNIDDGLEQEIFSFAIGGISSLPSGKEVLLIKSFVERLDYMIVELFRFDENCSVRQTFSGNKCILGDNKTFWEVIARSATNIGLERFIEGNFDFLEEKKVVFIPANEIDNVEDSLCAKIHSKKCNDILKSQQHPLHCLHCSRIVSETPSLLVEIDDLHLPHTLGLVHRRCLRPIDRIVGTTKSEFFENHSFLRYFDVSMWVKLINESCGHLARRSDMIDKTGYVYWDSKFEYDASSMYCIKINLKDGSHEYSSDRGRIQRFKYEQLEETISLFNQSFEESMNKNDPFCYSSRNKIFGSYSDVIKIMDKDEKCIDCISAEISSYSALTEKIYNTKKHFYAPVAYIVDQSNNYPFMLNGFFVMITEPLHLESLLENWSRAGFIITDYEIKIVESDIEFDSKVDRLMDDGIGIIVDPLLSLDGNFIKGLILVDFHELGSIPGEGL